MTDLKPDLPPRLISELVADADFPKGAVRQKVDIRGFVGVVLEFAGNSIKVRSAEGNTVSYNIHTLRKLYGPRIEPEKETPQPAEPAAPSVAASKPEVKRHVFLEPNFDAPLVPIERLVQQPDYPRCALGTFVDLHGFDGVVVELVGHSLKVRSRQGSTRSYNADGLRKLYGPGPHIVRSRF